MQIERIDLDGIHENRTSVLKEYYSRYLTEIRGLKDSSVRHYLDALNNISRRLKSKDIVQTDIYEIMDLDELDEIRSNLFADPEFAEQDTRGRRMYSAGLNNYYRFASGEDILKNTSDNATDMLRRMDIPIEKEEPVVVSRKEWRRSNILREQALSFARFSCEIDRNHESFIAEKTNKPYMEGHHAIPINYQPQFKRSLDVYANIVCLCPICHRRIHHGRTEDRKHMMYQIYQTRGERLANSGILLSKDEFVEYA